MTLFLTIPLRGWFYYKVTLSSITKRLSYLTACLAFFCVPFEIQGQSYSFSYDESGNRISRQMIQVQQMPAYKPSSSSQKLIDDRIECIKIVPTPESVLITTGDTRAEDIVEIQLVDISGKVYLSIQEIQTPHTIDMIGFPPNTYILRCLYRGEEYNWKLIKNK